MNLKVYLQYAFLFIITTLCIPIISESYFKDLFNLLNLQQYTSYTLNRAEIKYPLHEKILFEQTLKHQEFTLQPFNKIVFDPLELLCWWRFDIIAKYIYAWYKENNIQSDWPLKLYAEHIKVWGDFREWDGSKSSLDDYIQAFDDILASIKKNGFDEKISLIRIDNRKYPCEASHRIGASIFYKKPVICYYDPKKQRACHSSSTFFRYYDKYVLGGLKECYLDYMAYHYTKIKSNTALLLVTLEPSDKNNLIIQDIRAIIREFNPIIYEKNISLTSLGARNILEELNIHSNISAQSTFDSYVFLIENNSLITANYVNRIATLIGEPQAFIISARDTVLEMSKTFFSASSIHFLNTFKLGSFRNFDAQINILKNELLSKGIGSENICLVKGAREAACGIKECSVLNIIVAQYECENVDCLYAAQIIDEKITQTSHDNIIFNPENHFYYRGLKCALTI